MKYKTCVARNIRACFRQVKFVLELIDKETAILQKNKTLHLRDKVIPQFMRELREEVRFL